MAERVSTLDLISNGRVELGLGEGGSTTELHPFGRRFRDKREVWDEAVQALIPMLGDAPEGTEFHGKYFDFPLRNVLPKPRQKPHPPLWVACSQYKTIERAGSLGMGALGFQFLSVEAAVAWVNAYYGAFVHNLDKLADYQTNPNMAMVSALMCSTSDEEARRRSDGWSFFQFALVLYNKEGPFAPGSVDLWQKYLEWRENPEGQQVYSDGLIGTPARICEQLDEFANAHVDQVILLTQAGKNTHEDICESLELFAKEVMPEFHGREAFFDGTRAATVVRPAPTAGRNSRNRRGSQWTSGRRSPRRWHTCRRGSLSWSAVSGSITPSSMCWRSAVPLR